MKKRRRKNQLKVTLIHKADAEVTAGAYRVCGRPYNKTTLKISTNCGGAAWLLYSLVFISQHRFLVPF